MSVDCRVYLPLGTAASRVMAVLGRALGTPTEFVNRNPTYQVSLMSPPRQGAIDSDRPCARNNFWMLELSDVHASMVVTDERNPLAGCNFMLVDLLGQKWRIPFGAQTPTEDHARLLPDSSAVGIALGIRAVRFFGGKVVYNDGEDGKRPDNHLKVAPANALFPPMAPGQDDYDRHYQFQNALLSQLPLTLAELSRACASAAYPDQEMSSAWMRWARVERQRVCLETQTAPAPKMSRPASRL